MSIHDAILRHSIWFVWHLMLAVGGLVVPIVLAKDIGASDPVAFLLGAVCYYFLRRI